ncbi:aldo/keto reductase [Paenibacillus sp. MCAF20]
MLFVTKGDRCHASIHLSTIWQYFYEVISSRTRLLAAQQREWLDWQVLAQMVEADRVLRSHGMRLASNQVKFSLLDRDIENNGILDTAKELNAAIIAFSPLKQGILTGKFHDNPQLVKSIHGPRRFGASFRPNGLQRSMPLIDTMRQIASHYDATVAQIALNWLIHFNGDTVFAIPGASKAQHAEQNVKTLRFKLTIDEMHEISEVSKFVIR